MSAPPRVRVRVRVRVPEVSIEAQRDQLISTMENQQPGWVQMDNEIVGRDLEQPARATKTDVTTNLDERKGEDLFIDTQEEATETRVPPVPGVTVHLRWDENAATAQELFDTVKRNIRIDGTTYACSHSSIVRGSREKEILKVYCCAMVKGPEGWFAMPSYRNPRAGHSSGKGKTTSRRRRSPVTLAALDNQQSYEG
jgi:hypothetical protein